MPKISDEDLKKYFESNGSMNAIYTQSVELYNALRIHADGDFPGKMIEDRRPSETDEILEYRKTTYKPITKLPISKVISSLSKIRRSDDWSIDFDAEAVPSRITPEETLEKYCNENLPSYTSITNWAFGLLLKQNVLDANAVIAVIPRDPAVINEYLKPVPIVFNSDQVIAFNEVEKFAILKSRVTIIYTTENNGTAEGSRFYYIDDKEVIVYDQTGFDEFKSVFVQPNSFNEMPVWKVHAEAYKNIDNQALNKSRVETMTTFLDEAACEYSDLKASKIQHLYPLFWYYQNKECDVCTGTGQIPGEVKKTCGNCGGSGKIKFSPYAHIEIDPPGIGETAIPNPPAGYVARDTEILKLQEASVDKNLFKSLSAINMQFLDQTPLSISGDAKQVDREELNNFVYNIAEDIVYSIDKAIHFINEWRYSFIVQDKEDRKAMLPNIPVPQNFDLLPETYLMKEVADARNAKVNPMLIAILEKQLAAKKFYNEPDLATTIGLYFELDPLPGISVDDKLTLKSSNAITEEDFVISTYMAQFIKRAMIEEQNFAGLAYKEQMDLLKKYAKEKTDVTDNVAQAIDAQKQKVIAEMNAVNGTADNGTAANVQQQSPAVISAA